MLVQAGSGGLYPRNGIAWPSFVLAEVLQSTDYKRLHYLIAVGNPVGYLP